MDADQKAMNSVQVAMAAVLVVFALNAVLLGGLIALKAVHRRRDQRRDRRRKNYLQLLSSHLAFEHFTEPITEQMSRDEAFLDAIIDLRNTVSGPEVEKLAMIATRNGVVADRVNRLRSRFPLGRRLRAAVALAEMGDSSSSSVLMEHLSDREDEIRVQAARGLGRMGHAPAIKAILDRLAVETPWVRARFGDTLVGFGANASHSVMSYIEDEHLTGPTPATTQAIRVIGAIGDVEMGPRLTSVLPQAVDAEIRIGVVEALGSVGGPPAVPTLLEAYGSEDWRVAAKAATALGEIGDPSAIGALSNGLEDEVWWVRRNSAAALAMLPGGITALYDALTSRDPFARDAAAEALDDAGELAKARAKHDVGEATRDELRLLRHMRGSELVAS